MILTDCSPDIGEKLTQIPGARNAVVVFKHLVGRCSDQNDYVVACFLPGNNTTPMVVWRLAANETKYDVQGGDYCFNVGQLKEAWVRRVPDEQL